MNQDYYNQVFSDLTQDLDLIHNVLDIIRTTPQVVTDELLLKASERVRVLQQKVKDAQPDTPKSIPLKKRSHSRTENLIQGIVKAYQQQLEISTTFPAKVIPDVCLCDQELVYILKAILDVTVTTRKTFQRKPLNLSVSFDALNVTLLVEDLELYIPEEELSYFFSGNSRSREYGAGYAIYSAQRMAQKQGGSLTLKSGRRHHACFQVNIPYIVDGEGQDSVGQSSSA